jgi:hypothetical protein
VCSLHEDPFGVIRVDFVRNLTGCGVISEVVARNLIERFSNKTGQCRVAASESAP